MSEKYQLAVNGTLMRGFPLNENLIKAGAKFLFETKTGDEYRLWSIRDRYPAMMKATMMTKGRRITVEVWELDAEGLLAVLEKEPPGLTLGRVWLQEERWVLGILAEPWIVEGQREITEFGGWREYTTTLAELVELKNEDP